MWGISEYANSHWGKDLQKIERNIKSDKIAPKEEIGKRKWRRKEGELIEEKMERK